MVVKSKQKENALNFTKILKRHSLKQKIFIYLSFTHHTHMKQSKIHKNKEKKLKERKRGRREGEQKMRQRWTEHRLVC